MESGKIKFEFQATLLSETRLQFP